MKGLALFEFDSEWSKVVPILGHPLVVRALDAGMIDWCDRLTLEADDTLNREWDVSTGPWAYSASDHWLDTATERFEEAGHEEFEQWCKGQGCPDYSQAPDAWANWYDVHEQEWSSKLDDLMRDFYPKPATPDWYRCHGACHWLAGWSCAIGELLFPAKVWHVVAATEHSTVIGIDDSGILCMDVLWGKCDSARIWREVREGQWLTLMDVIERSERRPHREEAELLGTPSPRRESASETAAKSQSQFALAD